MLSALRVVRGGGRGMEEEAAMSGEISDHDRLVEMSADIKHLKDDVHSLREWRHEVVAPAVMGVQAQGLENSRSIGQMAAQINKLTDTMMPLANLPGDFRRHLDDDREIAERAREAIVETATKFDEAISGLHKKLDENQNKATDGRQKMTRWLTGLIISGLVAVIAALWGIVQGRLHFPGAS